MPRTGPARSVNAERNVARQVRALREGRGWTYEGTAKRMTDVGCPMKGTTVYKIERSEEPPRRITGDEIAAFAVIFGREPSALMLPPEVVEDERLSGLLHEARVAWQGAIEAVQNLREVKRAVGAHLAATTPGWQRIEAAEWAVGAQDLPGSWPGPVDAQEDDLRPPEPDPDEWPEAMEATGDPYRIWDLA